jgi:hypothetical protein
MGEAYIVRKGGVVTEQAATPTITEVSKTDTTITFTVTNNDAATATVYYDFDDEVTSLSEDNVTLATTAESDEIEVTGLTAETQYTIYSVASAFNKMFSPQASLAITTEETPVIEYELLYDSTVAGVTYPVQQIDITGLNITKDDELRFVYTIFSNHTSDIRFELYVNDNFTITNYWTQTLTGSGTSFYPGRPNLPVFAVGMNTIPGVGFCDLKISNNNRAVWQTQYIYRNGSNIANNNANGITTFDVTSITKLSVKAQDTGWTFVSGSRIRLYKVNTGEA